MTKLIPKYSERERKILELALYCALFTTFVLAFMNVEPAYFRALQSSQPFFITLMVLCTISILGTTYLTIRMLVHCAGNRNIPLLARLAMLLLFLFFAWIMAGFYYVVFYRRVASRPLAERG
jgi:hypothetical protein